MQRIYIVRRIGMSQFAEIYTQESSSVLRYIKTPFLTAPAEVQYFTGVRPGVTGVQPRSPGYTGLTMKSLRVHPSKLEMQNLVGVEISALKSDWGAL